MSSPSPSEGPVPPLARKNSRISKGRKSKNGTFILPSTGERVRRQITLRKPTTFEAPSRAHSENGVLPLSRRRSSTFSQAGTFRTAVDNTTEALQDAWVWIQTPTAKNIGKCGLAYLLGSMATFLPIISNWLGHQDGKHMVATITVYFHPGRSAGAMEQAALLAIAAFFYATFIAISSMATSVFFESQLHLIKVGFATVLIVFCGGGLGFLGWIKQRYSTPLVNVACSLASLAIVTVLTKENAVHTGVFTDDKIVQVMKMVILGVTASLAVNLLVFPFSARTELRETMIKTTDSFGDMLTMITRGFLSGSETDLRSTSFIKAQTKHKTVFKQLTKNLDEAKYEHYALGTEEQYKVEVSLVNCMQRLAHSIGGLRSAAMTQFTLLKESGINGGSTPNYNMRTIPQLDGNLVSQTVKSRPDRFQVLTAIEEASDEGSGAENQSTEGVPPLERHSTERSVSSPLSVGVPTVRSPAEIFARFIIHLGPSMKSLAYTLSQILQELPFGEGPDYSITINEHFKTSLTDALQLYSVARSDALKQLYKTKDLDKDRPESIEADFEEVAASCGHFSFSLQTFASEMQVYLSILEELKEVVETPNQRSWKWMKSWKRSKPQKIPCEDPEREGLIDQNQETELPKALPELVLVRRQAEQARNAEVEHRRNQGFYSWLLNVIRFIGRDDIRFAVKVGIGASLYALIAFIPETRPFYRHWRGEWGLVSYMLVCSMTIGASNTTGWSRFMGTGIGAIAAMSVWMICQGNVFALAFCGWLASLPCFYLIVAAGRAPLGRFTMLTYNLSCLYGYSLSIREGDNDEDEGGVNPMMAEITLHRFVAVISGIIWGLIITRVIWPISARQKFKDGLSLLWLRMGLIWKRDPLSTLIEGESQYAYMDLKEEFALHRYGKSKTHHFLVTTNKTPVLRLENLRLAAPSEFELSGPFPVKSYGRILDSTTKILDAFHAMNVVIQKNLNTSEGESLLLKYTADERTQLCARISHLFQVLASSLKLEYPINDALPSTRNSRDRLLARIWRFRKEMGREAILPALNANTDGREEDAEEGEGDEDIANDKGARDEDYELLYAYILVTGQISEEIERVEKDVEELFGVIDEEMLKLE